MKKLMLMSYAMVMSFVLSGCGEDSPADVLAKWRQAVLDENVKVVKELTVEEEREKVPLFMAFLNRGLKEDKKLHEQFVKSKIEVRSISENKAELKFSEIQEGGNLDMKMVKINGKWFVDIR